MWLCGPYDTVEFCDARRTCCNENGISSSTKGCNSPLQMLRRVREGRPCEMRKVMECDACCLYIPSCYYCSLTMIHTIESLLAHLPDLLATLLLVPKSECKDIDSAAHFCPTHGSSPLLQSIGPIIASKNPGIEQARNADPELVAECRSVHSRVSWRLQMRNERRSCTSHTKHGPRSSVSKFGFI